MSSYFSEAQIRKRLVNYYLQCDCLVNPRQKVQCSGRYGQQNRFWLSVCAVMQWQKMEIVHSSFLRSDVVVRWVGVEVLHILWVSMTSSSCWRARSQCSCLCHCADRMRVVFRWHILASDDIKIRHTLHLQL